jgi:uncharacterized protein YcnI
MRSPLPTCRLAHPARVTAVAVLAGVGLFALALPADAHVTVAADDSARGAADSILTFRVPNEEDAAAVKVDIKFPVKDPIASVKASPKPGWTVTTKTVTFNPPIKTDDGTITSGVGEVIYTATSAATGIPAGQFDSFHILVGPLPDVASLAFPTVETYGNGKVQSWVEPITDPTKLPESPTPVLTLTAAPAGDTAAAASASPSAAPATGTSPGTTDTAYATKSDASTGRNLGVIGIVVGALGLLVGGFGVLRGRRAAAA